MPELNMMRNSLVFIISLCAVLVSCSSDHAVESSIDPYIFPIKGGNMWKLFLDLDSTKNTGCIFRIEGKISIDSISIPPEFKSKMIDDPNKLLFYYFYDEQIDGLGRDTDYVFKTYDGFIIYVRILREYYYFQYPSGEFKAYTYSYSTRQFNSGTTVNCDVSTNEIEYNRIKYKTFEYKFDNRTVFSFSNEIGLSRYIEHYNIDRFRYTYLLDSVVVN